MGKDAQDVYVFRPKPKRSPVGTRTSVCSRCHNAPRNGKHAYCKACNATYLKARHRRVNADKPRIRELVEHGYRKDHPLWSSYCSAKHRAKHNGLPFDLDLWALVVPVNCPVLGIPLDSSDSWHAPSLDRFDNTKGYTHDNVRVISFRANHIKTDATADELEKVLAYVRG